MTGIGPAQLLIIALVVLLLFGAKKLPDAARSIGRSMRIFKSEVKEMENDSRPSPAADAAPVAQPATPAPQSAAQQQL